MGSSMDIVGPSQVHDPATLEDVYRLRAAVWQRSGHAHPQAFPDGRWTDSYDARADHFVVRVEGTLAAAARYTQWASLYDIPDASYFAHSCVNVTGPIGLPERLVVDPQWQRQGLYQRLADTLRDHATGRGAQYLLMECTSPVADLLIRRGRRVLGEAPYDPRFPKTTFLWVLSDLRHLSDRTPPDSPRSRTS